VSPWSRTSRFVRGIQSRLGWAHVQATPGRMVVTSLRRASGAPR
jgi:hypothetical protein